MSTAFIVPVVRRVTKRETWKLTRHANPGDRPSNRPLNNPAIRFGCAGVTCCGPVDSNWPLPLPQHRPRRPSLPPPARARYPHSAHQGRRIDHLSAAAADNAFTATTSQGRVCLLRAGQGLVIGVLPALPLPQSGGRQAPARRDSAI